MKKLIIAEKPTVARELAKILKGSTKTKEYYENKDYIITSLFGHLLELYRMEDYNKDFKEWNIEDLPYFPNKFKWKIKKDKGIRERYNLIQDLILRKDVDVIINCGDNDREGEVLVNNIIYDIFKKNKIEKTVKRILLPDLAEKTIKEELDNLKDIKDTASWYEEGLARTYIDWIYGINFSRFVSLKAKDRFPVGRVIVPTVKFVYDRQLEINNFKEEKYLQLQGIIYKDGKEIKVDFGDKVKLKEGQEDNQKEEMLKDAENICKGKITISDIEKKEIIKKPKKLFSLKTLQNNMFNKYKIGINKTLNYAQSLYEKTYTTYPRTNSEYLTEEEKDKVKETIDKLIKQENLNIIIKNDKRIFDSSKVESHSAIIITSNKVNNNGLSEEEIKIYNAIRNRFLANFCKDDCIIEEQKIKFKKQFNSISIEGEIKGTLIKQKGYLEFENDLTEKDLPKFTKGEEVDIEFTIIEKATTPPGKVTEAELNNFYENPFKKEKQEETTDDDYIAILAGCEIGTPATRAGIIEKVKQDGYIEEKKNHLEITQKGIRLIEILNDLGIDLYKEKTVEIGKELKAIYNKKNNINNVLEKIKAEVKQGINKELEIKEFEQAVVAVCPICKKNMYESNKNYYCEDKECGFVIWKQICGKKLTKGIIKELIDNGKTKVIKGFKSKSGKSFSASLIIKNNKVQLDFGNNTRS